MQIPLPDAPDPPSLAQILVWAFYGIGIAVVAVLTRVGFLQGKGAAEYGTDRAEIAGALIDGKKADEIVRSNDAQTMALANAAVSTKAMADALAKNTDMIKRVTDEMRDARNEIRDLTIEIARSGKR